ncbi:MAG: bifunctional [glutamate--ammonia ligase]-adenylyl-L-tyrosine phosphorylase/[glutamate--ammonia-ligase] adenylyltransferase, partial [Nitrospinae bacterium]|nr:bifunctional [glutamate--ammonia ligase]-adenylyl-L-tyrosine phosphorylase/[glutamate--ammonia-ligase] adenylyltransferase [Nitrospinota bacterium]
METVARTLQRHGLHRLTPRWMEKAAQISFAPEKALVNFQRFVEKVDETDPTLLHKLNKRNIPWIAVLFSGSQALTDMAMRSPHWLFWALEPGILHTTRFKRDMRRERETMLHQRPGATKDALCDFRNRELMRIGWRDLLKWADTVETLEDLSRLADVSVEGAMNAAYAAMAERFGRPMHPDGSPARSIVLGMGKLGGRELNFSSDIDLIYIYDSDDGETEGGPGANQMERPRISINEFYARMAQMMTSTLNDIGPGGNLYRVDLGLRPEGNRGPITCSLASAELYYESWGQQWERQMMIKARAIAGAPSLGDEFMAMIRPFVYRKSMDFSALGEILLMKEKIDKNLKAGKNKYKNNVKLGKGGIREIEFLIQAHQLIYGGKMPWFAETNSLKALHRIFERGLIGHTQYAQLADALLFLRDLENRMQITYGRQVQILPEGDELAVLAHKMNFPTPERLMAEYERRTDAVNAIFTEFFKEEAAEEGEAPELFLDIDNEEEALAQLKDMGFNDSRQTLAALLHIRDGEPFSHPSTKSRKMFMRLLPPLIRLVAANPAKDRAVANLDKLMTASPVREPFYQMLLDFPPALDTAVKTASLAQNLADALANQPDAIDILSAGPDPARHSPLAVIPPELDVYDRKLDWLRKERNSESLRIGIGYLMSHNDPFLLMQNLTALADAFVQACMAAIETDMAARGQTAPKGRFAVIGLGKLGRRELAYGSDLDLMFVYSGEETGSLDVQTHYTALARRLLAAIGGISQYGLAYRVDARLRPEGEKGIIALAADAAAEYYATRGALWERMALCGARAVAGDLRFGEEFLKNLNWFVYGPGLSKKDEADIERMKKKMER